jgi:hypothetical protein
MKTMRRFGLAAVALSCVLSACAKRDTSAVIACELNGKIAPTTFTFNTFRRTLEREHGQVVVEPNARLTSDAVDVRFKLLPDGTLLAEQVFVKLSGQEMAPAVFFGLTNTVHRQGIPKQNDE